MFRIKKLKRIGVKFLDFITYNKYAKITYITGFVIFIGLSIFIMLSPLAVKLEMKIWLDSLFHSLIMYFVVAESWMSYRDKQYIEELERSIEGLNNSELKIDLAALCHNIWSEDVGYTSNNVKEHDSSLLSYNELSEEEKAVNLDKASKILEIVKCYV